MQKTEIVDISFTEFEKSLKECVVLSTLGTITSVDQLPETKISDIVDLDILDGHGLRPEDCLPDLKEKNNKRSDGYVFGRCARSRSAARLVGRAHQLRRLYKQKHLPVVPNACFLTLTFTYAKILYNARLHDGVYVSCIQRLFKKWKKENKIIDFLWIAERHTQSERHTNNLCEFSAVGRLHFHCVVFFNGFQDVQKLNDDWLSVLENCKTVEFPIVNNNGDNYQPLHAEWFFRRKNGIEQINTIDYIKLLTYINKYVKKQSEFETDPEVDNKIYARCWGCSRGVSSYVHKMYYTKDCILQYFRNKVKRCSKVTISNYNDGVVNYEYTIYVAQIDWRYINSAYLDNFLLIQNQQCYE